jgi:hypothetical protein
MKSITKILIPSSVFILILFFWKEIPDLSIHKKINADKISAFFTAIGSLLTAVTVYLLYKQIQEQIEDRKAASRPDLFPASTKYYMEDIEIEINGELKPFPIFRRIINDKRDAKDSLNLKIHNIGLGAARDILVKWHYNESKAKERNAYNYLEQPPLNPPQPHSFILANDTIEITLPFHYMQTLGVSSNSDEEAEKLFIELNYKDISGHSYKKFFTAYNFVDGNYLDISFMYVDFEDPEYAVKTLINK